MLGLAVSLVGCSSSGGAPVVTQTGRTVEYIPCQNSSPSPVAGATVTVGSHTTTTAANGTYSIPVPSGERFTMTIEKPAAPSFVKLIEAEDTVTASYNRGDTKLISTATAGLLSSGLPKYDTTRALLTIELVKTGSCTDVGGTKVTVTPSNADALMQYPAHCYSPDGTDPFATDGIFPAAVVYNLTPGKQTVSATSPKCTQIPYPYTDPTNGLTYDGTVTTEAGTGTSFVRVFMK